MSKHTPGPWQYRTIDGSIGGIDDAKGNPVGQSFAVLIEGKRNIPVIFKANRERIANAMLMAAAPELLALLIESQENIGGDWRERRDAAIAKAMGIA